MSGKHIRCLTVTCHLGDDKTERLGTYTSKCMVSLDSPSVPKACEYKMLLDPKSFREVQSLLTGIVTVISKVLANTSVASSMGVTE